MDNSTIADNFSLLSKLMDIHGDDSFKSKTYSIAAFNIDKMPVQLSETNRDKLFAIKGIGSSVGKKVIELLDTGNMALLQDYLAKTPPGIIEMLQIKGIGPKKINTIWKEMEIELVGELLYACNENRLMLYKGFGEKTQLNIQEAIEYYLQNQGSFLFAQIHAIFPQIDGYLKKLFSPEKVAVTGSYSRQMLTIDELEFVILDTKENIKPKFQSAMPPEIIDETAKTITYKLSNGLKLKLYTDGENMAKELFATSASEAFLTHFSQLYNWQDLAAKDALNDHSIFDAASITYIPTYLRETAQIITLAQQNKLPTVLQTNSIKGMIHNHSNWSDGANTVEEMAKECIKLGHEYLVISDHSKTAVYAQGLTEERVKEQHKYINELNLQLAPFKIFKSIESDILNDGSLDYSDEILASFDLVIASVHSNLKMTEEKAMSRVLKAIENPYTTILGHPTGRLLLSRKGYPLDYKTLIDACAKNKVVIELNAHPRRLDIDWTWIPYALEKNVLISINPDAHHTSGFMDVKYGVLAAQKGGLSKEENLSSFSLKDFENYLQAKKQSL